MSAMEVVAERTVGCSYSWQGRNLAQRLVHSPSSVNFRIRGWQVLQFGGFKLRDFRNSRCLRRPLLLSVASVLVEPVSELGPSPSAQDILDWNLDGWKVVLAETGESVGYVEEVMSLASYFDPSVVEYCLLKVFDSNSPGIEYLIPWVDDVVKEVDAEAQCVLISPPEGLMELARRPELLRKIRVALEAFGLHTEGQREPHMPTRRQLQAAGEQKLIDMIVAAGGFSSVAQDLRFRTKRRPVGFWEDLQNLDSEIEIFFGECWREETNADTGKTHYVNLITGEVASEMPPSATIMNPTPVSQNWIDCGTAVMPRAVTLRRMGRYDLHNAIMMHGGYREVAEQLGRMFIGRREVKDLESDIRKFMRDHNLSLFPKPAQLIAENRNDLLVAVREQGGVVAVAKRMGLRAQRNGKGRWKNVEEAAEAMKDYLFEKLLDTYPDIDSIENSRDHKGAIWKEAVAKGLLRLPRQADIVTDGRADLRYALQKYGQEAIADRLGIQNLTMRRPRIPRPSS